MADEYGVAINTARSALEILRQEGLIAVRHGQGSYVLSQPESGGADAENADVPSVAAVHQQLAEINRRLAAIEERLNELAR
ncbi:hypothetical protein SACE_0472 [Saccharopolyspora erythraea prophage pSE101]|uniref:HTH gntR-type domain-containing protein n=1 Tax=Saccharopolyspora erythraea (strain ATCC 11635 / DSM 40517 / JCM 4748 / NBRC 13426 / NCIMB 8594 / NRRL 2338) TaxID=405948 RepID=A4F6Z7_SACEN|nr:hypothetical protein SACE_0472 [Saccharopolyspora erythraea NRRL 2338]